MEKKNNMSIIVSAFAVIISIFSLITSFLSYKSSITENLFLHIVEYSKKYETKVQEGYGKLYPAMIFREWNCLLVNNSKNPITLFAPDIEQISSDFPSKHSRMSSAFFNGKGELIKFPIVLCPGECMNSVFSTTILLSPDIYDLIKDKYPIGRTVAFDELKTYLFSKGVDFYGNPVRLAIFQGGSYMIEYPQDIETVRQQVFVLTLKSAKGQIFSTSFSQYDNLYRDSSRFAK